jgi:hypothetical protein
MLCSNGHLLQPSWVLLLLLLLLVIKQEHATSASHQTVSSTSLHLLAAKLHHQPDFESTPASSTPLSNGCPVSILACPTTAALIPS